MSYEVGWAPLPLSDVPFVEPMSRPFLSDPRFVELYPEVGVIVVRRSGNVIADWVVPLLRSVQGIELRRPFRLLPYAPVIINSSLTERERRNCVDAIARFAVSADSGISSVELPLAPHIQTVSPFADVGMTLAYRQTYVVSLSTGWENKLSSTCANNIRHARAALRVEIERRAGLFDCERGITYESADAWRRRSMLADMLVSVGRGTVVSAYASDHKPFGQCFVAWDKSAAYLLHNWRDKASPRGAMNLLIAEAFRFAQSKLRVSTFDLEGSVLAGVDEFYSTFGAQPTGYPYLVWRRL
jgi:hypothetical protein